MARPKGSKNKVPPKPWQDRRLPEDQRIALCFEHLKSQKWGHLTVLSYSHRDYAHNFLWNCQCDCGAVTTLRSAHIFCGVFSCGCSSRPPTRIFDTAEYRAFGSIKTRCYNPAYKQYADYGGRGITVCERWLDPKNGFANFCADMGPRPSTRHSIERRDNDGPYAPWNCYWATRKQQDRNKRSNRLYEINGVAKILPDWCEKYGQPLKRTEYRLRLGWPILEALSLPKQNRWNRRRSVR